TPSVGSSPTSGTNLWSLRRATCAAVPNARLRLDRLALGLRLAELELHLESPCRRPGTGRAVGRVRAPSPPHRGRWQPARGERRESRALLRDERRGERAVVIHLNRVAGGSGDVAPIERALRAGGDTRVGRGRDLCRSRERGRRGRRRRRRWWRRGRRGRWRGPGGAAAGAMCVGGGGGEGGGGGGGGEGGGGGGGAAGASTVSAVVWARPRYMAPRFSAVVFAMGLLVPVRPGLGAPAGTVTVA